MSERGCIKCGYILAGLPAAGTVVSCPECGQATDLASLLPRRMHGFEPFLWGLIGAGLYVLFAVLEMYLRTGRGHALEQMAILSLIVGAAATTSLTYRRFAHEPAMGRTPRPPWMKVALSVGAGILSLVLNVAVSFGITMTILWLVWR